MIQIPSKNIVVQGSCSIRLEDWCSDGKLPEGSRWIGNRIFAPITSGYVKWPRDTIYTPGVYLEIADRRLQSLAAIWLWRPAAFYIVAVSDRVYRKNFQNLEPLGTFSGSDIGVHVAKPIEGNNTQLSE